MNHGVTKDLLATCVDRCWARAVAELSTRGPPNEIPPCPGSFAAWQLLRLCRRYRAGYAGIWRQWLPRPERQRYPQSDSKALSLLFDAYQVNAGGNSGHSFDRKSCNVAIPVHVPQGLSVSVLAIDYRGFNHLPAGARSQFNVEYFFAGATGPAFRQTFAGPQDKDYLISNQLTAQTIVWSPCGVDVNLRTNSSIRLTTTNNQEAMATVDTEDVTAAIVYRLQTRACQ